MEDSVHACEICSEMLPNRWSLILHRDIHSNENICLLCQQKFETPPQLFKHLKIHILRRHQASELFECGVCLKNFEQEEQLSIHFEDHINGIRHTEETVQSATASKRTLYICPICNKVYVRSDLCQQHLSKHLLKLNCSLCGTTFSKYEHLENHIRSHTGESSLECNQCSKSFNKTEHLKRHIRMHSGETPYKCDTCSKSFSRKDNLQKHIRTHYVSRVKCTICSKEFKSLGYLKIHTSRSHTNNLRFKYDQCDRLFFTAGNLQFHKKTHKNETIIALEIMKL